MRINESRIRRIIREEARRVLREAFMGQRHDDDLYDATLEIMNISTIADNLELNPDPIAGIMDMMQELIDLHFDGRMEIDGYSEEHDSILLLGHRRDLELFVRKLEHEIHGPAQSIEAGDGLDYSINDM